MSSVETETLVAMIITAQSHHTMSNYELKRNSKGITHKEKSDCADILQKMLMDSLQVQLKRI